MTSRAGYHGVQVARGPALRSLMPDRPHQGIGIKEKKYDVALHPRMFTLELHLSLIKSFLKRAGRWGLKSLIKYWLGNESHLCFISKHMEYGIEIIELNIASNLQGI